MNGHAPQCGWHCDQIPDECNCGVLRPATVLWAMLEVSAARSRMEQAEQDFHRAKARLADTEKAVIAERLKAKNDAEGAWYRSRSAPNASQYEGRSLTDELAAKAREATAAYDAAMRGEF